MESLQLKPGEVIYKCPKCCCIKPERAHHCRYDLCPQQGQAVHGSFQSVQETAGQQSQEATRCLPVFLA